MRSRSSAVGAPLVYLSNARLPSEKANALQSLQQCEAFGRRRDVEFWHPFRAGGQAPPAEALRCAGVDPTFRLETLASRDFPRLRRSVERLAFLAQAGSFQLACLRRLRRRATPAVVYSRNSLDVFMVPFYARAAAVQGVFIEDHDGLARRLPRLKRRLLRAVDGIVVTTALHAAELEAVGLSPDRVLVAPNGVKLERFGRREAPTGPPFRVAYVGNLFRHKGVFVLVDAVARLPREYRLEVVGGSPETLGVFQAYVRERQIEDRVDLLGHLPATEVPARLSGAHVAVLPNSAASPVSSRFTSPLKMFEYMAAGVPIVATDVPAIREVLRHDNNAWLVRPDDAAELAAGIRDVCQSPSKAEALARRARQDVEGHTWEARAARILAFIDRELPRGPARK
jgi:glycosyltransferase involved in cell wall biosynthesis